VKGLNAHVVKSTVFQQRFEGIGIAKLWRESSILPTWRSATLFKPEGDWIVLQ